MGYKMKNLLKYSIVVILVWSIMYFLFSFIMNDLYASQWSKGIRAMFVFMAVAFSFVGVGISVEFKED